MRKMKFTALATLVGLLNITIACADELENLVEKVKIAKSVKYTPQTICLALIRSFALYGNMTVEAVVEKYGAECGDNAAKPGEFRNENWIIKSYQPPDRPNEIEAVIAGPAAKLSEFSPVGYELYIFRVILFIDLELELTPYLYYRTSRYNFRSLEELNRKGHRDNVLMDPIEEWEKNFLPKLNSSIYQVAEDRINRYRTNHTEE